MEDFLPILIGVIWLAYTWYSKDQKKKARAAAGNPKAENVKRQPSILEQILMGQEIKINEPDESNVYEEEEAEEIREYEPVAATPEKPNPFLNTEMSEFREEGQSSLRYKSIPVVLQESDEEDYEFDFGVGIGEFDVRKAVIYSEILNPPYIDYK